VRRALYAGSVLDFYGATRPQQIDLLATSLYRREFPAHRRDRGELGSWIASLPALAEELHSAGLGRLWVAVEYQPYQAGRSRADAVLMGVGRDGRPTYLVVELKQWQGASWDVASEQVSGTGARYESAGLRHPYDQAFAYGQFIRNFTSEMHDTADVEIEAVAFLHNATERSIETLRTAGRRRSAGTFSGDAEGRRRFRDRLHQIFDAERDGVHAKDRLADAHYRQGPALLDAAAAIFGDSRRFPLTDEQYGVFGHIQNAVSAAMDVAADRNHAVIVVKGGPGTGKTWIAMHLLGANAAAGRQVNYATNSTSLRSALRKPGDYRWMRGVSPTGELVTSARTFWDDARWVHPLDLLVVDEAHRLEEYTVRRAQNNPRALQAMLEAKEITQLFELKKSAKVLVLFIDEDQASTYRDFVTVEQAELVATRTGASFTVFELEEQHRSGGSQAFEAWVDTLVDASPTEWHDEENFTVRVANSPEELEALVMGGPPVKSARLLAGFCWEWQKFPEPARSIDDVPYDIEIDGWRKRWNLRKGVDGYPKDTAWAQDPRGAAQVGSIFTAQGFEFDRCGVILGPDLIWNGDADRMVVQIEESHYKKLVQLSRRSPAEEVRVRNQYRVLLTRAMREVVLYSTDPETRKMLNRVVNPS
jgi:uncharacterized protein